MKSRAEASSGPLTSTTSMPPPVSWARPIAGISKMKKMRTSFRTATQVIGPGDQGQRVHPCRLSRYGCIRIRANVVERWRSCCW